MERTYVRKMAVVCALLYFSFSFFLSPPPVCIVSFAVTSYNKVIPLILNGDNFFYCIHLDNLTVIQPVIYVCRFFCYTNWMGWSYNDVWHLLCPFGGLSFWTEAYWVGIGHVTSTHCMTAEIFQSADFNHAKPIA